MADELLIHIGIEYEKDRQRILRDPHSASIDVTNNRAIDTVQEVGTSEEAIDFGELDLTALGWIELRNLNPKGTVATYITVRCASGAGYNFAKLYDDEPFLIRAGSQTYYVISSSGTINMQVRAVET